MILAVAGSWNWNWATQLVPLWPSGKYILLAPPKVAGSNPVGSNTTHGASLNVMFWWSWRDWTRSLPAMPSQQPSAAQPTASHSSSFSHPVNQEESQQLILQTVRILSIFLLSIQFFPIFIVFIQLLYLFCQPAQHLPSPASAKLSICQAPHLPSPEESQESES